MQALHHDFSAMGSACSLQLLHEDAVLLQRCAELAVAEVRRIEFKYSRYRSDSLLSRVASLAGSGQALAVDAETAGLLDYAAGLHASSEGLFDISSGVLRRAWDFRSARLPQPEMLRACLALVGWDKVAWDGRTLYLPVAGMELDFGGFGKEYAVDRAAALLQELGIRHGHVNLGGDIRVLGPRPDGSPWLFGIQHPRQPGQVLAQLPLTEGALATSGDYERYFELEGRRYCHVLDPRSGEPVSHWQSVSVVAPLCSAAGSATTLALLMQDRGLQYLEREGLPYLAVDAAGQTHLRTSGG